MKSSIKVSRGGRSITFRGAAARSVFESMTGTKLPDPEQAKDSPTPPSREELAKLKGVFESEADILKRHGVT